MQNLYDLIKARAIRAANHLGVDPAELVEGIQSYTVTGTILADRTGSTAATAITGDSAAADDGTNGDHVALEPNTSDVEYLVLAIVNYNTAGEEEVWGMGDFFSGGQQVALPEHASGSTFAQRRVDAQAFSVNNADSAIATFPYSRLPTAKKDTPFKAALYNYTATNGTVSCCLQIFYVPVRPGTWKNPGPSGICRPCSCVK